MIDSFRIIGKHLLEGIDFSKELSISDKEKILRLNSINVKKYCHKFDKKEKKLIDLYPLIINLNTQTGNIEFEVAKYKYIEKYIFLEKKASAGSKISFFNNNSADILLKSISDSITEMGKLSNKKDYYEPLLVYFENIYKKFYIDDKLKYNELYFSGNILEKSDDILKVVNALKRNNNFSNLTILTIDNENIIDSKYKDKYVSLIFDFYFLDIINSCKDNGVVKKFNFSMKFFNTDKKEFSFNLSKDFYKSCPLTLEEYFWIFTGMSYIKNNQSGSFLKTPYFILPNFMINFDESIFDIILSELIIQFKTTSFSEKVNDLKNISEFNDLYYSLDFYKSSQNYFKIIKDISDISLLETRLITKRLYNVNETFEFLDSDRNFNFSNLNYLFFSSNDLKAKNNDKSKFKKDLIELIYGIYHKLDVSKDFIFELFFYNLKKEFFDDKSISRLIFNFNKLLFFLELNNNIKEGKIFMETYSEISNNDLQEYFVKTKVDNLYKKGLIIFGYLINQVIFAQYEKARKIDPNAKRNKTFIKKVGFDGLDEISLVELYNELREYEELYNVSKYNCSERVYLGPVIETINQSKLTPLEINYYILLGIELGKYIGIKHGKITKDDDKDN